jgi:hypothetical protein
MPIRSIESDKYLKDWGVYVTRPASVLPQTATVTFFTVTGPVLLMGLHLEVTTAIQAQANAIKFRHTPTGGSVGDISGTIDVNGFAVGEFIVVQGPTDAGAVSQSPVRAGLTTGAAGVLLLARPIFLLSGNLGLNAAASSTGGVKGHLWWKPVPGYNGKIVAA